MTMQENTKLTRIEDKIDRAETKELMISQKGIGALFQNMLQVMEAAKLMAVSGPAVPRWLQGNPGGCWACIMQAIEWGMSPIAVARSSMEINGVVSYNSQLTHALIEARAPLAEPLIYEYTGEGPDRACTITGKIILRNGTIVSRHYTSPMWKDINPKNSPLWKNDPDQQLFYFSSRAWARRVMPHILAGLQTRDEIEDNPDIRAAMAKDVTAASEALHKRLVEAQAGQEHSTEHLSTQIDELKAETEAQPAAETEAEPRPKKTRK